MFESMRQNLKADWEGTNADDLELRSSAGVPMKPSFNEGAKPQQHSQEQQPKVQQQQPRKEAHYEKLSMETSNATSLNSIGTLHLQEKLTSNAYRRLASPKPRSRA